MINKNYDAEAAIAHMAMIHEKVIELQSQQEEFWSQDGFYINNVPDRIIERIDEFDQLLSNVRYPMRNIIRLIKIEMEKNNGTT